MKTTFKKELALKSFHLDKKTIVHLEQYLTNNVSPIIGEDLQNARFRVQIAASDGEHILPSIDGYPYDKLPDDITSLSLSYGVYFSNSVSISFTNDIVGAKIRIELNCESPKDKANTIIHGIMNILSYSATTNYIFHPHPIIKLCLGT